MYLNRHYIKGFFLIDLISSIPYPWLYSIFISSSDTYSNSALLIFEFLPILKFIRICTLRRYIQQINANFGISQTQHIIIWLVILTLLIFHWSSCLSYIVPYIVTYLQGKPIEDSDAYYISTKLYNSLDWEIYLIFLHIGVSNLIGSNFKEFESFGTSDKAIRCILLLLGKSYIIYLIVIILQLLESSAKSELKYQQIMLEVKKYIRQKKLPLYLQDKLILYYKYRYWGYFFDENIISKTLSNHLNEEILLHSSQRLLDIPILRNLPHNVLRNLLSSLKMVIYLKDDVIYKAGTEGTYMYFIANGTVALITYSGKEICHLYDGDYFGHDSLLSTNQRRQESVIALEVCELLCLNRYDFKRYFAKNLRA
ncbi:hypothetical protein PUN28_003115 [Cardiocondyla obscurior]|uniref:Cyclic nucleotide-binding domain-containing protein n=1 Tax=Cardiocondyla obscurior TaxID=286306 RepID=A0AAW2GJ99_9HYME